MRMEARLFRGGGRVFEGWRVQVDGRRGIATPAVWGDSVVFGGGFGSHHVYSVEAGTGTLRWRLHTRDDGPTAAVVVGDTILFNTESCTLVAADALTGEIRWEKWLGDPLLAQPAATPDTVVMVYPAGGRHWLVAFDLQGGERWKTPLGHDVITAPVLADGNVYVATYDGNLSRLDLETGTPCWTKFMGATSAPWIANGRVFVAHRIPSSETRTTSVIDRDSATRRDAAVERTAWVAKRDGNDLGAYAGKAAQYLDRSWGSDRKGAFAREDAAVGFAHAPASAKMDMVSNLVGERHVSRAFRFQGSRPVVHQGVVFDTTGDRLEARDMTTNGLLWTWAGAPTEEGERRLTPPAVANGRVLIGTWDGRILSLDAFSGRVRWDVSVGAPCHWQPVMAEGRIVAGLEDGSVVAFETGDSGDTGWAMWGGGPGHNGALD